MADHELAMMQVQQYACYDCYIPAVPPDRLLALPTIALRV